jgi:pimeloyl-ACP methyl ester carboxylesterase
VRIIAALALLIVVSWCSDAVAADCSNGQKVDVGGYALWMRSQGQGSPTIVFESGGGEDSSEWSSIEPIIRGRGKVRTVVYDRAGLGNSDVNPRPYRIQDEATALRRALDLHQDQAYPATAHHMRDVQVPLNLPLIDITAEHTWVDTPDELAAMRRAHAEFVAASSNRMAIFAKGSGHYISRDQPEIVIDAVLRLVSEIQEKSEVAR